MGSPLTLRLPAIGFTCDSVPMALLPGTRQECLEQILKAFFDIADRDDIHQAAARLDSVQQWIGREAARAAADPIFADCSSLRELPRRKPRPRVPPSPALGP
jgi:hypothetical protein